MTRTSAKWRADKMNLVLVGELNRAYQRFPFSQEYEGIWIIVLRRRRDMCPPLIALASSAPKRLLGTVKGWSSGSSLALSRGYKTNVSRMRASLARRSHERARALYQNAQFRKARPDLLRLRLAEEVHAALSDHYAATKDPAAADSAWVPLGHPCWAFDWAISVSNQGFLPKVYGGLRGKCGRRAPAMSYDNAWLGILAPELRDDDDAPVTARAILEGKSTRPIWEKCWT